MRIAFFRRLGPLQHSGREALNTICSNISFAGPSFKKVVVTSCNPGEGKSYLCMQMAYNLAKRGKRVVLVDADMRRSSLVNRYGVTTDGVLMGLAHLLAGYCTLDEALYQTNVNHFCLIPVGREVANPVPLLNSQAFSDLLDYLARYFDMVLVDAPPVGMVIDAAEIAGRCDGVILLAKYNETRRREMLEAKRQIEQTGCPILGCVLNNVALASENGKKYGDKAYYSDKKAVRK